MSVKPLHPERHIDRWIALGFSLLAVLAASLSIPCSLWEWDEVLFAGALHDYDVAAHLPHPPGFPVYVGTARLFRLLIPDDVLSLSLTSVLFAAVLGAGLYASFRFIFRDRAAAAAAAFLTLMSPAVLIHAGAPRSDVPGMAVGLGALALALHGSRSARSLVAAGAAAGLAFGLRVTVLPAVGPVLLASMFIQVRRGRWKPAAAGMLLAALFAALCYAPAALKTGIPRYAKALTSHAAYAVATDSIAAGTEKKSITHRTDRFFNDPWGGRDKARIVFVLALAGLALAALKDRRALAWLALCFLPVLVFSVLFTTPLAGPLYSLPFLPLFTGLAAFALVRGARLLASAVRRPGLAASGMASVLVLGFLSAGWTWPVMAMRRAEASPPAQACQTILERAGGKKSSIWFESLFTPHVRYFFPGWKLQPWDGADFSLHNLLELPADHNLLELPAEPEKEYALSSKPLLGKTCSRFAWSSKRSSRRLGRLGLGRYLEAYTLDLNEVRDILWLDGWRELETDGLLSWRRMERRARVALLASSGEMTLRFRAAAGDPGSTVVLSLDGKEVDRFVNDGAPEERALAVRNDRQATWRVLTVEVRRSIPSEPGGSSAEMSAESLRCFGIEWVPEEEPLRRRLGYATNLKEGWYEAEP
ncbi:MAG: hypothetical protein FJY83_03645, partial [Candidatus Aminicenantes bacterium]|nr:hypothetical protein [Candidatus Aminicenantes bacterium]